MTKKRNSGHFLGLLRSALVGMALVLPVSAFADWKAQLGEFRIGVVGGSDPADVLARMEPFRLAVEEELGLPVTIIPSPGLRSLVLAHSEGRNEYAVLSASAYAAAWVGCECIEPLVIAKSADGSNGVHSVIITRKSGGINSTGNLSGSTIIALGENATLGYAYPVHALQKQKIDLAEGSTTFIFPESGEEALRRFSEGEGDGLIGWTSAIGEDDTGFSRGTLSQLNSLYPELLPELQVIWKSEKIPHRVHSVRKNLEGEPKRLLRELLVRMYDDDPVAYDSVEPEFAGGFEVARQSEFAALVDFVKAPIPRKIEPREIETDSKQDKTQTQ